jgi:hypothetical protein
MILSFVNMAKPNLWEKKQKPQNEKTSMAFDRSAPPEEGRRRSRGSLF